MSEPTHVTPAALKRRLDGPDEPASDGPSGDGAIDEALERLRDAAKTTADDGYANAQGVLDAAAELDANLQERLAEAEG